MADNKMNIIDILVKPEGFDIALMTTFNFEIPFFDKFILNRLYANNIKKVSIFVDYAQFNKSLQDVTESCIGRKYMVSPVKMNAAFHPKVILLLGEKQARLIVGSSNIKTSGYMLNNEVFNYVDYNFENPEYLSLINKAIDFFMEINSKSFQLDNALFDEVTKYVYYGRKAKSSSMYLLHNMEKSILEQVQEIIGDTIESIDIAVPYYDNELKALTYLKEQFQGATITAYIQNGKSTFPVELNEKIHCINSIKVFDGFDKGGTSSDNNFYHGKVFLFKSKDHAYVLYGSVNCTQAALINTYQNGGNIECDFLSVGSLDEFDYFFENMTLSDDEVPQNHLMVYEEAEHSEFHFLYGEENDSIQLHIGFSGKNIHPQISLGGNELEYEIQGKTLLVYVPAELSKSTLCIFEINIKTNDVDENVSCWTYDQFELTKNRLKNTDQMYLAGYDLEGEGDKFREDRIKLMKAEITCVVDLQEYMQYKRAFSQASDPDLTEEDPDEDYHVDFELNDDYVYFQKKYHEVDRIRTLYYNKFIKKYSTLSYTRTGTSTLIVETENASEHTKRKATSEERMFERFVKNKVNRMFDEQFLEKIDVAHYIELFMVVTEIMEKYHNIYKVEDIFDSWYIFETKADFIDALLEKEVDEDDEQINSAIKNKCYEFIIYSYHFYNKETDTEDLLYIKKLARNILLKMERKFQIRNSYQEDLGIDKEHEADLQSYIEHLFGYKTFEMLKEFVSQRYENAECELRGKYFVVKVTVDNMRRHYKPNDGVLREVKQYADETKEISSVKIIVNADMDSGANQTTIKRIEHMVKLEEHSWKRTIVYDTGRCSYDKAEVISF